MFGADEWAVPGVPFRPTADDPAGVAQPTGDPAPAADEGVEPDVAALTAAVERALLVVPSVLSPRAAVVRAEALLALQERVGAAAVCAVADVEERGVWRERQAGSTRTWLRTLPCGDTGQLALSRLLRDRPVLGQAFADGRVSARTFGAVARELARVPLQVLPEQLEGVLVDGLGELLRVWAGAACLDPTPEQEAVFDERREQLATVVRSGLQDTWSDAAGKLEPAFTLAATVLAPAEVVAGVRLLVDALQPRGADRRHGRAGVPRPGAVAAQAQDRRLVVAGAPDRRGRTAPARRTDYPRPGQPGPQGPPDPAARRTRQRRRHRRGRPAAEGVRPGPARRPAPVEHVEYGQEAGGSGDGDGERGSEDPVRGIEAVAETDRDGSTVETDRDGMDGEAGRFGTAGAGVDPDPFGGHVEGEVLGSRDQRAHDAFAQLLADLTTCAPGAGTPAPSHLTITASVDALDGKPGAPPGRLHTSSGDVPLTPSQLRRHACSSLLSAVLTDARGRPVAASGDHRHATARERRALHAAWGSTCAVNGCALTGTVPHHAEPWWKTHQTTVRDLVPLCQHHHHDLHDGSKTLRLRDSRCIDEWGWTTS